MTSLNQMGMTIADSLYMQGYKQGFREGFIEGFRLGRLERLREDILRLGKLKFGEVKDGIRPQLEQISDENELERLFLRVWKINSWNQLFERDSSQ